MKKQKEPLEFEKVVTYKENPEWIDYFMGLFAWTFAWALITEAYLLGKTANDIMPLTIFSIVMMVFGIAEVYSGHGSGRKVTWRQVK